MAINDDVLCVVPCRLGSMGLKRKNLRIVNDKTLLHRAVDFAMSISIHVIVTSESAEVSAFLANTPVMERMAMPPKCHGYASRAVDVWLDAWDAAELMCARNFGYALYLEPTSPLRERWMAREAIDMLKRGIQAVWTVEEVPLKYNAARQFQCFSKVGGIAAMGNAFQPGARRQELLPYYIRNGAVYGARRGALTGGDDGVYVPGGTRPVFTKPLVNIDTEDDLREADRILAEREAPHAA